MKQFLLFWIKLSKEIPLRGLNWAESSYISEKSEKHIFLETFGESF